MAVLFLRRRVFSPYPVNTFPFSVSGSSESYLVDAIFVTFFDFPSDSVKNDLTRLGNCKTTRKIIETVVPGTYSFRNSYAMKVFRNTVRSFTLHGG